MGLWGLLKPQESSGISGAGMNIVGGDPRTAQLSSGSKTRISFSRGIETGVLGRL